jgi:hypothetical protein
VHATVVTINQASLCGDYMNTRAGHRDYSALYQSRSLEEEVSMKASKPTDTEKDQDALTVYMNR